MNIKELAIKAFNEGTNTYGETPTGEVLEFTYSKILKQYFISLEIMDDGCAVSTDVGIKETKNKYSFISGNVVFKVDKTKELKSELKKAKKVTY